MANKTVIAQKEEQVKNLAEHIKGAKIILLVDYRGTTVADDTKLRKDIREVSADIKVIKNNIIKRALDMNGESGLDSVLEGPTAMISSSEDYLQPLKAVYKFTKDHENYKIKGGIIEGEVESVELLAKLAGSLLGTISKLAVALDQVKSQKEAQA